MTTVKQITIKFQMDATFADADVDALEDALDDLDLPGEIKRLLHMRVTRKGYGLKQALRLLTITQEGA